MDSQPSAPPPPSTERRRYWLRTAAVAVFAVFVSVVVSAIGRSELWKHPESIAFAVFLFLIPILQSVADRRRVRNWPLRLTVSLVAGVIGGFVYALFIER
jgi:cytochrome bd-type quinol oxidase subunit 2